jgi:hypothetical protein
MQTKLEIGMLLSRLHTQYDYLAISIRFRITHTVGLIFALRRKKLRGSYLFFKATSRS